MFVNRLSLFKKMYFEELEVIEKEMIKHPFEKCYINEWQIIADLITQIEIAQKQKFIE